jgi:hypothetical protein
MRNFNNQAEEVWQNLDTQDLLEASAAHPKTGARTAVSHQTAQSADWSNAEQSGTENTADAVRRDLKNANRSYENKFGFNIY